MRRSPLVLATLLLFYTTNVLASGMNIGGGGSGSGDMLASDYATGGIIKVTKGGTGADSSGSTGAARVVGGTWQLDNAAAFLSFLGMSAIENTAISTWAGSTNLTTLGTVGTGTWNATAIGAAKGGTGIATDASTGFPYVNAGTWSVDNAATHRTNIGLGSSDNVTFGTVNAGEFVSTAADNTRGATIPNTSDPTGVNLAAGKVWVTDNTIRFRNNDNTATIDTRKITILDNTAAPTADQVLGNIIMVAGTSTVTLPTAVAGMSVCVVDNAATASDIIVDVQAGDNVVLVGVTQAGGVGITNASGSSLGDYVCLFSPVANRWMVLGKQGTWSSQ